MRSTEKRSSWYASFCGAYNISCWFCDALHINIWLNALEHISILVYVKIRLYLLLNSILLAFNLIFEPFLPLGKNFLLLGFRKLIVNWNSRSLGIDILFLLPTNSINLINNLLLFFLELILHCSAKLVKFASDIISSKNTLFGFSLKWSSLI